MTHELSPIAIADDGELSDVRRLLRRLDLPFLEAAYGPVPSESLRISNPRCALHLLEAGVLDADSAAFHIVVLDADSAELRGELRTGPFDFLVQRPVHPAALRLLILHALYCGPERRSCDRVAMDAEVQLGGGFLRRGARLVQLSERGCGLLVARPLEVGEAATVVLPKRLTGGSTLRLDGRVVASQPPQEDGAADCEVSVAFRPPSAAVRRQLRALMASRGIGAAAIHPRRARCGADDEADGGGEGGAGAERRRSPRKLFRRPVLASASGGVHTLIGRDLSTGGMRVAADPRLQTGDEFKLVVYGRGGQAPLIVKAVVTREDDDRGCVLQFREVGPSAAAWLAETVESLPEFTSAERGPHLVVSEIIEDV